MNQNSIGSSIGNAIHKLDMFGIPISFYMEGNLKHRTVFGGCITIIIAIAVIGLSFDSISDLMTQPTLEYEEIKQYFRDPPITPIDKESFPIAVGHVESGIGFQNSIFSINLYKVTKTKLNNGHYDIFYETIPLVPCTPDIFDLTDSEFLNYGLNYTLCPGDFTHALMGSSGSNISQYIKINVTYCTNNSNPFISCADQETIDNYINNTSKMKLQFYFQNTQINPSSHPNPIIRFIDNFQLLIAPNYYSMTTSIDLVKTNVYTTSSIISQDIFNIDTYLIYENNKEVQAFFPQQGEIELLDVTIKLSNRVENFIRRYKTIGETFAILSGYWSMLYFVLGFFARSFNQFRYKVKLADRLYEFDIAENIIKIPGKSISQHFFKYAKSLANKSNSNRIENKGVTRLDSIKKVSQNLQNIKASRSKLKFTYADMISKLFMCLRRKKTRIKDMLLSKAIDNISHEIDITWVLRKFQEFDKLKKVMLNQKQLELFDFVPPPLIRLNSMGRKETLSYKVNSIKSNNIEDQVSEYLKYYKEYSDLKKCTDDISRNLLEHIDEETLSIFKIINEIIDHDNLAIEFINGKYILMPRMAHQLDSQEALANDSIYEPAENENKAQKDDDMIFNISDSEGRDDNVAKESDNQQINEEERRGEKEK